MSAGALRFGDLQCVHRSRRAPLLLGGGACMSIVDLKSKVWKLCVNSTEVHRFVNVATISITKSAEVG